MKWDGLVFTGLAFPESTGVINLGGMGGVDRHQDSLRERTCDKS